VCTDCSCCGLQIALSNTSCADRCCDLQRGSDINCISLDLTFTFLLRNQSSGWLRGTVAFCEVLQIGNMSMLSSCVASCHLRTSIMGCAGRGGVQQWACSVHDQLLSCGRVIASSWSSFELGTAHADCSCSRHFGNLFRQHDLRPSDRPCSNDILGCTIFQNGEDVSRPLFSLEASRIRELVRVQLHSIRRWRVLSTVQNQPRTLSGAYGGAMMVCNCVDLLFHEWRMRQQPRWRLHEERSHK
jgi:hypothetical protein